LELFSRQYKWNSRLLINYGMVESLEGLFQLGDGKIIIDLRHSMKNLSSDAFYGESFPNCNEASRINVELFVSLHGHFLELEMDFNMNIRL